MVTNQSNQPPDESNRVSECLTAMEAPIRRAMDEAFDAGWTWTEITTAMMEIAMDWSDELKTRAGDAAQSRRAKVEKDT